MITLYFLINLFFPSTNLLNDIAASEPSDSILTNPAEMIIIHRNLWNYSKSLLVCFCVLISCITIQMEIIISSLYSDI